MTAKQYLLRYSRIQERLRQMDSELQYIEAQIQSISGSGDGMPRGTDISDRTGNIAVMLADAKEDYEYVRAEALRVRRSIESVINMVEDPLQSRCLYERYINCKEWKDVADSIPISESYAKGRLHGNALESVRRILEVDTQ